MSSYPSRNWKFPKKKKIQKIKKNHYGFFSTQNKLGKADKEKERKKSFRWAPTRPVIENSKKIAKKFKNLKNTIMVSLQAKISWEWSRKRENKIKKIFPTSSYPTRNRKFQKKSKKNSKKLKNTIMAYLQAKISWERPRKRENKK